MALLVEGKSGFVTGSAGGIGRGIALELAREGAQVVVSDLPSAAEGGQQTVEAIRTAGGRAEWVPADVTSSEDVATLVQRTVEIFGALDFAVNNAGVAIHKPLTEVSPEEFDRIIGINLKGVFLGLKHAIPEMLQAGSGAIVNVASVAGLTGVDLISPYTASKHGIVGLTKNAALEYSGRGVRVNAVAPNAIRTPLMDASPKEFVDGLIAPQAMKRVGEPEEVGFAVAALLSDRAGFITGVTVPVDGGYLTGA